MSTIMKEEHNVKSKHTTDPFDFVRLFSFHNPIGFGVWVFFWGGGKESHQKSYQYQFIQKAFSLHFKTESSLPMKA